MRIVIIFLVFFSSILTSTNSFSENIKPFTSDGCSAFPDGTFSQKNLWLSCCTIHDYAYWQGGTYEQRLAADNALQQCVALVGEPNIAKLMLAGVRVGGTPYFPTQFRWSYGWSYPRFYQPLTEAEKSQIKPIKDEIEHFFNTAIQGK